MDDFFGRCFTYRSCCLLRRRVRGFLKKVIGIQTEVMYTDVSEGMMADCANKTSRPRRKIKYLSMYIVYDPRKGMNRPFMVKVTKYGAYSVMRNIMRSTGDGEVAFWARELAEAGLKPIISYIKGKIPPEKAAWEKRVVVSEIKRRNLDYYLIESDTREHSFKKAREALAKKREDIKDKLVAHLQRRAYDTNSYMAKAIKVSVATIRGNLRRLRKANHIKCMYSRTKYDEKKGGFVTNRKIQLYKSAIKVVPQKPKVQTVEEYMIEMVEYLRRTDPKGCELPAEWFKKKDAK